MTPEEKFELLQQALQRGAVVETLYRRRRIAALERDDGHVVIRYANGDVDRLYMRDFGKRRFVVII